MWLLLNEMSNIIFNGCPILYHIENVFSWHAYHPLASHVPLINSKRRKNRRHKEELESLSSFIDSLEEQVCSTMVNVLLRCDASCEKSQEGSCRGKERDLPFFARSLDRLRSHAFLLMLRLYSRSEQRRRSSSLLPKAEEVRLFRSLQHQQQQRQRQRRMQRRYLSKWVELYILRVYRLDENKMHAHHIRPIMGHSWLFCWDSHVSFSYLK